MGGFRKENKIPVKEIVTLTGILALLYSLSLLTFSSGQREAIMNRDKHRCQYPGCNNKTQYKVEVHHVVPQGYSIETHNMRPDTPLNAVCLCEEHHVGYPKKGREHHKGLIWNPIHPDTYFVHLILVGKFELLPLWLKQRIRKDFPGLLEYYENINKSKRGKRSNGDYEEMFSQVMRTWRSEQLKKRKVYWNTQHDYYLQTAAINATLQAIRKDDWKFPLRMLGGNVKRQNRGLYAWDNLVALSIQNYIIGLTEGELKVILDKMVGAKSESRIVYYTDIYVPAINLLENRTDMGGILNRYINLHLNKEEGDALIKELDAVRDEEIAYKIIMEKLYEPAIKFFRSKLPQNRKSRGAGVLKKILQRPGSHRTK